MTSPTDPTLYDEVPYPGGVFPSTHPEHLATIASLYGMDPVPVDRCRVLELGCGFGANLLPMAFHYPQAKFVGIDLSGSSVARGQKDISALSLSNAELHHLDILDVGPDFGEFDYIISHGVFSWVPDIVRNKILAVFKANLSPQGVCYVSYNAYPYSHARNLARDMVLFHTRGMSDSRNKIAQARAILRFLSDAAHADSVHGAILREQYTRVSKMADEFFFHDDLNETAQAFLLYQVVERAQSHGLQYLSDADFARGVLDRYPDGVRSVLEGFPNEELVARDQYQDFIDGFGFRRTLLCHDNVVLRRKVPLDFVRRCYFTSASSPVQDQSNSTGGSELQFGTRDQSVFGISHGLVKVAYLQLGKAWPRALAFDELVGVARAELLAGDESGNVEDDATLLAEAMFKLACNDAISFSLYPRGEASNTGKPRASLLARRQSETDTLVVNLLHQSVRLESREACRILQLLDGSRNFDQLVDEVRALRPGIHSETSYAAIENANADVERDAVQRFLIQARKLALLVQ
ncbi:MAG: class I SAM-dependent methyltransferase [Bradyrhizobium sp.]|jgi:SAM-dependent methyltransferase